MADETRFRQFARSFFSRRVLKERVTWHDYLSAFLLATFATGVVYGLEYLTVEKFSNISGFLIVAVLLSAILLGKGPAVVAAAVCSLLYDWLLVPPFLGAANSADNIIKFSVFVIAALLTSWIAGMSKNLAVRLKRRERDLMAVIDEREKYKREKQEEVVKRQGEALRNAILASVSHDLKTPLSSIIGAMSSLKLYGRNISEGDREKLNDSVLAEADKLLGYVDNLLEVAKLEEGRFLIARDAVAFDDVLDLTLKRMERRLRRHRIVVREGDPSLAFRGDEKLIGVALGNILDNAAKFSPPGTRIIIGIAAVPGHDMLAVEVADEGVGVPEGEEETIFDKFHRAKQADAKNAGTGLGLWIARRIVEAHGGDIRIRRRGSDTPGACVRLTLPAASLSVSPDDTREEAA
ncbi:sensor histidine kinase [Eilatimonas milleporae]|uniref:histidine kinase n=1 Tax=Eilatimonas milleporae TaxID=911205 RepID=A0A3M0CRF5_9PROT|nr:ATP-binding protein [Eilatimonas milleporae]RMB12131.1 two-component system sensor histidine kinase KdpD [Eilatimonas milleporae]